MAEKRKTAKPAKGVLNSKKIDQAAHRYGLLKNEQRIQSKVSAPPLRNEQRNRSFK